MAWSDTVDEQFTWIQLILLCAEYPLPLLVDLVCVALPKGVTCRADTTRITRPVGLVRLGFQVETKRRDPRPGEREAGRKEGNSLGDDMAKGVAMCDDWDLWVSWMRGSGLISCRALDT